MSPELDIVPGSDFGAYHVKRQVGSGGFAQVFLAVHQVLRRQVALKVVHPSIANNPEAVALFLREARIVARFDHPNIVSVYDAGCNDKGVVFMACDPEQRPRSIGTVLSRVAALLAEAEGRKPYAAPPGRAEPSVVEATHAKLRTDPVVKAVLEAMHGPALVLNEFRQIVGANQKAAALLGCSGVEPLLGQRPGELLKCDDAKRGTDGCGTSEACAFCGLGAALSRIQQGEPTPIEGECVVCGERGTTGNRLGRLTCEFTFRLSGINLGDGPLVVVGLHDLTGERRRHVLERSRMATLLDTANLVQSLADSSGKGALGGGTSMSAAEATSLLAEASKALTEEAVFQEHLTAAEAGELQPLWEDCLVSEVLSDVCARLSRHPVSEGRQIAVRCPHDLRVRTDRILLQRSVRNLVRNALEACAPGEDVTVTAVRGDEGGVEIRIHNPQVMSAEVRGQVFKRSFSTKAANGRGIGTHAARLFIEGYLHGQIGFISAANHGTTFWVKVPARSPTET